MFKIKIKATNTILYRTNKMYQFNLNILLKIENKLLEKTKNYNYK